VQSSNHDFFCVGVIYSSEYDVCDVTLSVYPHRVSFKNMPGHGGNRTYDLWNTSPIPKVVGSIRFNIMYSRNLMTLLCYT
jgi:hypothetical protein